MFDVLDKKCQNKEGDLIHVLVIEKSRRIVCLI